MAKLAPSILSADFSELKSQVDLIEQSGSDYIHVDVMDGHFVPNISFGAGVMKCLTKKVRMPFDVHLMIENPDKYAADFVTENTEFITVHQEASVHLDRTLNYIKSLGVKPGIAINPATSTETLKCILSEVDLILVMSVNPGFGGQKLIPYTLDKVRELKKIRDSANYKFEIEIDGGITIENVSEAVNAGADIIVTGSAVFGADDICAKTEEFKKLMER